MQHLAHQMRVAAEAVNSIQGQARWAVVTSSRSTDTGYDVKVQIQPEGVSTTWLPVLSQMVGNGWGLVCPPSPGQQVLIVPYEGNGWHYAVVGMCFSNNVKPPQPNGNAVVPGEIALAHQTGSFIQLHNDGSFDVTSNQDGRVTVGRNLTVTVTGNATVNVQGNATLNVTGTAAIFAAAIQLGKAAADTLYGLCTSVFKSWADSHTHSNGNDGGNTGPPTTSAGVGAVTTVVTGE
jgi:hypothetical protein